MFNPPPRPPLHFQQPNVHHYHTLSSSKKVYETDSNLEEYLDVSSHEADKDNFIDFPKVRSYCNIVLIDFPKVWITCNLFANMFMQYVFMVVLER